MRRATVPAPAEGSAPLLVLLDHDLAGPLQRLEAERAPRTGQVLGHEQVGVEHELFDEIGETIGAKGREFGVNTGRKRRCGWFDAVLVRQTVKTSGIDGIALTKLDILDGFESIKVCTGYRLGDQILDHLPANQAAQAKVEPIYETIEGWKEPTANARSWAELPAQAIKYVRRVEELVGCPIALLSTSPEREDTILVQNPFEA